MPSFSLWAHPTVIGSPVVSGLSSGRNRRGERRGRLLVAVGLLWSLAVLSEPPSSVGQSTGWLLAWLILPLLIVTMPSFPGARPMGRRDRTMLGTFAALVVALYIGSEPSFVESVPGLVGDGLAVLLLVGITASLAVHLRLSTAVAKATTAPVLVVSIVATVLLAAFVVARHAAPSSEVADALALGVGLCLPAMAAAFLVGILQRRLLIGRALSRLSRTLSASPGEGQLGATIRSAIGDPSAQVLVRDHLRGSWVRDGQVLEPSEVPGPGRVMREVHGDCGPVAAIVLDAELEHDGELVEAIVSLTEAALREQRLKAELKASLGDLDDSRKRIATAADVERRRIERDLHDGAQQRLIALRVRLALAEDLLKEDPVAAADAIRHLAADVDLALEEIRALAHGIYPAVLADRGLPDALRGVARRTPLPVEVRAAGLRRHPPEVESAVYYTCLEALQNVVKHGRGATGARVSLREHRALEFEVADDGAGFDPDALHTGAGLRNMRDRIESVGGTLTITSPRSGGTVVRGSVPFSHPPDSPEFRTRAVLAPRSAGGAAPRPRGRAAGAASR